MDKRIKEKLEDYGLSIEDLTQEELEELKVEIKKEDRGMIIIDGVLSGITIYGKIKKKGNL